ncbi:MAG TPA: hypothetical protein VD811_16415 [Desulfuromonadales bacterium]|nr:hypothetical protein [Desulfuromonadales bacterium]
MRAVFLALAAVFLLTVSAPAEQAALASRFAALLDPAADRIVRRAWVPSAEQPQGEVRLIARGGALVMQTALSSKVLRRVAAAISEKEERSWPEERDGFVDSQRYRETLSRAVEAVQRDSRAHPRPDRRQQLLIEFVTAGRSALYAIYQAELNEGAEGLEIAGRRLLFIEGASPLYVRGNLVEIAMDSFHLERAEAEQLIAALAP